MRWSLLSRPLGGASSFGDIAGVTKKEIPLAIPLAMAATSAFSSIWGGKKSADANREAERRLAAEKTRTEAERIRAKHQTWLDTASGQNMVRMLREQATRDYKRTAGAAAVGGATDAAVATAKELNNQKEAEVLAQGSAAFEDKKDAIDAAYRQELSGLSQQQIAAKRAQGQAIADAAGGVSNALMQGAVTTFGGTKLGQSLIGGQSASSVPNGYLTKQTADNVEWLRKNAVFTPRLQTM